MSFGVNANMEAKLAEYRARKINEQRQKETLAQRFLGIFRRKTDSGDSKSKEDNSPHSQQQSQESSDILGLDREEEAAADFIESPEPPQKYSWLLFGLKILLWVTLWLIFIELQFGAVFFVVSALVFVYINTRTGRGGKKKSLSAYSVFNPNCERLQGTITAEQFEAELLHRKPLAQS